MGQTFQFNIGLGGAPDIKTTVEIPMDLHDRISQYVGDGQMQGIAAEDLLNELLVMK